MLPSAINIPSNNSISTRKQGHTRNFHMLPPEIIEIITQFIEKEQDLVSWLKCFRTPRNFGDLPSILELIECDIATQVWPSLSISKRMNRKCCDIVSKISKYYTSMKFGFENIVSLVACNFANSTSVTLEIERTPFSKENADTIASSLSLAQISRLIIGDSVNSLQKVGANLICESLRHSKVIWLQLNGMRSDTAEVFINQIRETN